MYTRVLAEGRVAHNGPAPLTEGAARRRSRRQLTPRAALPTRGSLRARRMACPPPPPRCTAPRPRRCRGRRRRHEPPRQTARPRRRPGRSPHLITAATRKGGKWRDTWCQRFVWVTPRGRVGREGPAARAQHDTPPTRRRGPPSQGRARVGAARPWVRGRGHVTGAPVSSMSTVKGSAMTPKPLE